MMKSPKWKRTMAIHAARAKTSQRPGRIGTAVLEGPAFSGTWIGYMVSFFLTIPLA
jgi:hypothetical protein